MGGRAYFADECTAGTYDNQQYIALNLLGKTLRFDTDVSGAGCGCNAAMYLTSMHQNTKVGECDADYYCDANSVCGVMCSEIDIMEANVHAWHSTLHSETDRNGKGAGIGGGSTSKFAGWNGPRDWTEQEYGPGAKCIDTTMPYHVSVSFPTDGQGDLAAMELTLTQDGKHCPLTVTIADYKGMKELSHALAEGMTPIISYWSDKGMLWLDGEGKDHKGPCHEDHPNRCGESVKFYNWAVEEIGAGPAQETAPASVTEPAAQSWTPAPPAAWTPAPTAGWVPPPAATPVAADPLDASLKDAEEAAKEAAEKARTAERLAERVAQRAERAREKEEEREVQRVAEAAAEKARAEDAEQQSIAISKKRAAIGTITTGDSDCFKVSTRYLPINMDGSERSEEVSAKKCQERCSRTNGCAHFTYWLSDGGCHLQDNEAALTEGAGPDVVSGPASCKADAYCHKYIASQGCGWTVSHSCPGQVPGKIGLARDDGSRGFQCCCVYDMWKNDKEAAKRAVPHEPEKKEEPPMLCTASHGAAVGSHVCCGQEGFVSRQSHICPKSHPTCVGLVSHSTWGTCQVAEPWQQCGGKKGGKDWWGPTTCTEGYECRPWSNGYSQCAKTADIVMMKNSQFVMHDLFHSQWQPVAAALCAASVAFTFVVMIARVALRRDRLAAHGMDLLDVPPELGVRDMVASERATSALRSRPSATSLLTADAIMV